jgi:AbrB family looped-hinge helix DNA binding protein
MRIAQTTVSPKFQVVIPKRVREETGVKPGQKFTVLARQGGVITLVPIRPLREYRGFAKGMPTEGFRDKSDRL